MNNLLICQIVSCRRTLRTILFIQEKINRNLRIQSNSYTYLQSSSFFIFYRFCWSFVRVFSRLITQSKSRCLFTYANKHVWNVVHAQNLVLKLNTYTLYLFIFQIRWQLHNVFDSCGFYIFKTKRCEKTCNTVKK